MKTTSLGGEGLLVPSVGLGCMGMSQGYGQADDDESLTTLYRAIELGVTFWDTAQSYGAGTTSACWPRRSGSTGTR